MSPITSNSFPTDRPRDGVFYRVTTSRSTAKLFDQGVLVPDLTCESAEVVHQLLATHRQSIEKTARKEQILTAMAIGYDRTQEKGVVEIPVSTDPLWVLCEAFNRLGWFEKSITIIEIDTDAIVSSSVAPLSFFDPLPYLSPYGLQNEVAAYNKLRSASQWYFEYAIPREYITRTWSMEENVFPTWLPAKFLKVSPDQIGTGLWYQHTIFAGFDVTKLPFKEKKQIIEVRRLELQGPPLTEEEWELEQMLAELRLDAEMNRMMEQDRIDAEQQAGTYNELDELLMWAEIDRRVEQDELDAKEQAGKYADRVYTLQQELDELLMWAEIDRMVEHDQWEAEQLADMYDDNDDEEDDGLD